jgi:CheY-like chemotaxis protein
MTIQEDLGQRTVGEKQRRRLLRCPQSGIPGGAARTQQTVPSRPPTLRILVVDDTLLHRKLAARLLQTRGHSVTITNNGREAVDLLENEHFDLVLMDVEMPVMDGLTATSLIRNRERAGGRHTVIVGVTSSAEPEACSRAGMDAYLAKPLRLNALSETVQRLGVAFAAA